MELVSRLLHMKHGKHGTQQLKVLLAAGFALSFNMHQVSLCGKAHQVYGYASALLCYRLQAALCRAIDRNTVV
jgi:hypothetical protein